MDWLVVFMRLGSGRTAAAVGDHGLFFVGHVGFGWGVAKGRLLR